MSSSYLLRTVLYSRLNRMPSNLDFNLCCETNQIKEDANSGDDGPNMIVHCKSKNKSESKTKLGLNVKIKVKAKIRIKVIV